jgi:hypothetical protein
MVKVILGIANFVDIRLTKNRVPIVYQVIYQDFGNMIRAVVSLYRDLSAKV